MSTAKDNSLACSCYVGCALKEMFICFCPMHAAAADLIAALEAFVTAENDYRKNVIEHEPGAYLDPLSEAYDLAVAALTKAGVK